MTAVKFEGVDVLDFLGQIVELHTQHYKDDFEMDKELIQGLAACRKAYASYKQARAGMKELSNARANVEHLLDTSTGREPQRDTQKSQ